VQGIIAGGQTALWRAVKALRSRRRGAPSIARRGLLGHSNASPAGAPFVGAFDEARARGATVLLTLIESEDLPAPPHRHRARCRAGTLTGSTRLKSGTATKLVLNILTTLAMVKTGKVIATSWWM
jgi:N-acetylmuramic acid 6-phosphate etherase